MKRIIVLLVLASAAYSQQPDSKALGDAVREAQKARKLHKTSASKVYTEIGNGASESEPLTTSSSTKPVAETEAKPTSRPVPVQRASPAQRPVFDQAKRRQPEFIIVPAGTEIRVDIVDGKVVVPVRVGFATPIPPLSPASVKVNKNSYAPVSYNAGPGSSANDPIYAETAELTSVTVRGIQYPVHATTVPLNGGATLGTSASMQSSRDATFILTAPRPIER